MEERDEYVYQLVCCYHGVLRPREVFEFAIRSKVLGFFTIGILFTILTFSNASAPSRGYGHLVLNSELYSSPSSGVPARRSLGPVSRSLSLCDGLKFLPFFAKLSSVGSLRASDIVNYKVMTSNRAF